MSFSLSWCQLGVFLVRVSRCQPPAVYHQSDAQVALQQCLILLDWAPSVYEFYTGGVYHF